MLLSLVLAVILSILAVFFANYNPTPIQISFLGSTAKGTLGVVVVIAFGAGVLAGALGMLPAVLSRSWSLIRHKRRLEDLQSALQGERKDSQRE